MKRTIPAVTEKIARHIRPPEAKRRVLERRQPEMVIGTVTTVGATELDVTLRGGTTDSTGVKFLKSYATPTSGDRVLCIMWDSNLVVIGALS